jgi:hypothetical protein
MKKTTKATKPKPEAVTYTASIKILGKTYTSKGKSVTEVLANLNPGNMARGMGILTIECGNKSQSKVLAVPQVVRLFALSNMAREIAINKTAMLFNI